MNDQDYIKEGVDLAGWQTTRLGNQRVAVFIPTEKAGTVLRIGYLDEQHVKAALAARLTDQVDALPIETSLQISQLSTLLLAGDDISTCVQSPDRTMNTIKAIVDSKVLK